MTDKIIRAAKGAALAIATGVAIAAGVYYGWPV